MEKKDYHPKPFTQELAEKSHADIMKPFDDKRTLCNVIKQVYRCVQEESYNLKAARDLLLEALWMGQRMHGKLYKNKRAELEQESAVESVEDDWDSEEFDFSIDWSKLDGRNVAQGNWD